MRMNENKKYKNLAGCEVLTAVTMKYPIFWNVMLCSPAEVHPRFSETSVNYQTTQHYIPNYSTLTKTLSHNQVNNSTVLFQSSFVTIKIALWTTKA
jgi:hypothetical protein